ncbi:MAG: hypothetical protein RSF67_04415, partial [Clostridia bacterium]
MNENIKIFGTLESVGSLPLISIKDLESLTGKGLRVDKNTGEIISEMSNIISISNEPPVSPETEIWLSEGDESTDFEGLNIPEKLDSVLNSIENINDRVLNIENIFKKGLNAGTPSDTFEGYFSKVKDSLIESMQAADAVVALTEEDKRGYGVISENVVKINNPITLDNLGLVSDLNEKIISITCRYDIQHKGLDYLVKIAKKLPEDWKIAIAG